MNNSLRFWAASYKTARADLSFANKLKINRNPIFMRGINNTRNRLLDEIVRVEQGLNRRMK